MNAAAYARYSTDNQTENSIAYQLERINSYCADNDITVVSHYVDEALSGTNTDKRPDFLRMCKDAETGVFDAVVIYDITRGSRDVADWFSFRRSMQQLGVEVIAVEDSLGDPLSGSNFLTELLTVGIGQHHVLTTRTKSIEGKTTKAKQGIFMGGTPPLGYDVVDGDYVINEQEAQIVRTMFEVYARGGSYHDIIKAIPPNSKGKFGKPIGLGSINHILKNERYTGVYEWNKYQWKVLSKRVTKRDNEKYVRIENAIPRIIDQYTFERVQERMKARMNGKNKAKRNYLLSGLIECEHCGGTYVGHTQKRNGKEYPYYICSRKYKNTQSCASKSISANKIEVAVVSQIKMYLNDIDFEKTAKMLADDLNAASNDLKAEKRELAEIRRKIDNGMKAILQGIILPELSDELANLKSRRLELEKKIALHETNFKEIDPKDIVAMFEETSRSFGISPEKSRFIVENHIKKIYAHIDNTFTIDMGIHLIGGTTRI